MNPSLCWKCLRYPTMSWWSALRGDGTSRAVITCCVGSFHASDTEIVIRDWNAYTSTMRARC